MSGRSFYVNYVYSSSPQVIIDSTLLKKDEIFPGKRQKIRYTISPCSTDHFLSAMYISTSVGNLIHVIKLHNIQQEIIYPGPYFSHFDPNITASLDLPLFGFYKAYAVLDKNIFNIEKSSIGMNNMVLHLNPLQKGFYSTFITVIGDNTRFVCPIQILISDEFIVPTQKEIWMEPISAEGQVVSSEISIFSKDPWNCIDVIDAQIKDPIPDDLAIDVKINEAYFCLSEEQSIATITAEATGNLEFNSKIVLTVVNPKTRNTSKIEISLHVRSYFGDITVHFDPTDSNLFSKGIISFILENNFIKPIYIYDIIPVLDSIEIKGERTMILPPNGISPSLFALNVGPDIMCRFSINAYTNGSLFEYDQGYTELNFNVTLSDPKFKLPEKIYNGSIISVSFKINIGEIGSQFNMVGTGRNGINITKFQIFEEIVSNTTVTAKLNLQFFTDKAEGEVNKVSTLSFDYGVFHNNFIFNPYTIVPGDFSLSMNLPKQVTYGTIYRINITSCSTHLGGDAIHNITVIPNIENYEPQVNENITDANMSVANLSILFDQNFKPINGFFSVLRVNSSFKAQETAWKRFCSKPIPSFIKFKVFLDSKQYIKIYRDIELEFSYYQTQSHDFGVVHADEIYQGNMSIHNYFDSPIQLQFHNLRVTGNTFDISYDRRLLIPPNSDGQFEFIFEGLGPGNYAARIPVTTNITAPFFVEVAAQVEFPKIRFIDSEGYPKTHVVFNGGGDPSYMSHLWVERVYIVNDGTTDLSLGAMVISDAGFMSVNRSANVLAPGAKCEVCFKFSLWLYQEGRNELEFALESNGFKYILPITVELSEEAKSHLRAEIVHTMDIVSMIGLIGPFVNLFIITISIVAFYKSVIQKVAKRDAAIRKFSVNNFSSVAVQNNQPKVIKTRWVYHQHEVNPKATYRATSKMDEILNLRAMQAEKEEK